MSIRFAPLFLVGTLSLLVPAAALAQDAAPDDGDGSAPAEDLAQPAEDDAVGEVTGSAVVEAPPVVKAPYPQRALDRPRTLPGGSFQGTLLMNSTDTFAAYGTAATLLYSPVENLQLAGAYNFNLEPSDFPPRFVVAARYYSYKKPPHMFQSVQITLPFDFAEDDAGDRPGLNRVNLSSPIKYKFNDTVGMFFGDNLLDVLLQPDFGLALNVPFTVGVQVNDHVFVSADTNFARIAISNAGESEHIGDRIPFQLNALYAFSYTFDVVASVNVGDLMDVQSEAVVAVVGLNYRGGFSR